MDDDSILHTALRVLNAYAARVAPDPKDVAALRQCASPPESGWEPDLLAVHLIQREIKNQRARGTSAE